MIGFAAGAANTLSEPINGESWRRSQKGDQDECHDYLHGRRLGARLAKMANAVVASDCSARMRSDPKRRLLATEPSIRDDVHARLCCVGCSMNQARWSNPGAESYVEQRRKNEIALSICAFRLG